MNPIPINLAVEDDLSEAVLRRILRGPRFAIGTVHGRGGFGYLRKLASGWNRAAKGIPFLLLTDLDQYPCPAALIEDWLHPERHPNLLFRVAVQEVEAWLLADREGLAAHLDIREAGIPQDVETLNHPKAHLIKVAGQSRSADIRSRIVPRRGSTAKQGPDYNGCLAEFVERSWNVRAAARRSPSLARTLARVRRFAPTWTA